jgi:hypothetical protein
MKKMVILGAASLLGLAACGTRVPTNEQLTRLLHEDAAAVNDPQARLDALAVNCLRTWSGDAKLTQDLPPSALAAPAKGKCRSRIDGWIADAARNPDRLEFDDVSAPGAVQRAMALLETRDGGAQATASPAPPVTEGRAPRLVKPATDGPAPEIEATLAQANSACQKANEIVASRPRGGRLPRYAEFCQNFLSKARIDVDKAKVEADKEKIDQLARKISAMTATVESMMDK